MSTSPIQKAKKKTSGLPEEVRREVNRIAHLQMQRSFLVHRMRLEDQARALLAEDAPAADVLAALRKQLEA